MHTKGPWNISKVGNDYDQYIIYADGQDQNIANTINGLDNAKAIAATPDLLRACEKASNNIKFLCDMVNSYSQKLGLGNKVRAEDFAEPTDEALMKAREG